MARRRSYRTIAAGTDKVLAGVSLPRGCRMRDLQVRIKITSGVGIASAFSLQEAGMYGIEAWILPVLDPDAASSYDSIWDALVPKDTDVAAIDLDTGAADATPFFEPGEADWTALLDIGLRPKRVYARYKLLHCLTDAVFKYQDNQTPFGVSWFPGDSVTIRIRKPLVVKQPSVLVIGFASPSLDDTSTSQGETGLLALAEADWGQVRYMSHVVERAMLSLIGLTEAGAETPWEEAVALIQKHLEPDVFEETADRYKSATYDVYTELMLDHSVPGELGKKMVTTGR